ncbi:TetR/AcrR family transcriptional regulator [Marinibaculum pumilum]|uniref:TetR/AcrR family transcriptional regulator n=1 Tax=Marinibaculum pumilum TaxID=1766165 RepID=A0ABV7L7A6_9PROT
MDRADMPPSGGRRARKKQMQRAEILRAAVVLLREDSFERTRMEDVAEKADVSLKTVYNYFPSKNAILLEILSADRARLSQAYEAVAENPPDDLAEALAQLMHADIGDVTTPQEKTLWLDMLAAEFRANSEAPDEVDRNREIFRSFTRRILRQFRARGILSGDVDEAVAADMVYALLMYDFRNYCARPDLTPDDFLQRARQQTRLLVAGWTVC